VPTSTTTTTVSLAAPGGTYTGSPIAAQALVGTNSIAPSASLDGVAPTLTYYVASGSSISDLGTTAPTNVGTYIVVASFPGNANLAASRATAIFTISPATLTITAATVTKTYGQTVTFSSTAFSESGLVNGNTITGVTETSTGSSASATVGTYPIVPSAAVGSGLGNYTITYVNGTLTVNLSASGASVYVLDPSAGGALSLSGTASINVAGDVVVDSNSSSAILASGSTKVTATSGVLVVGSVSKSGAASVTKTGTPGATGDPLASLPLPGSPTLTNYGSETVSGNSVATIGPGIYSQITVTGSGKLTMSPGTYIIQSGGFTASGAAVVSFGAGSYILEGGGFSVTGSAAISGTGVTIFNVGSSYNPSTGTDGGSFGAVTLSGAGTVSLSPPSSGTYAGILMYQARDNAKALTFSGSAMQGITGTIYAAAAQLVQSGNAQIGNSSSPISIIVDTLTMSGSVVANALTLSSPAGSVAYTPAQIRATYGISNLAQDGTGQTIAIVDAYDDPNIDQALDDFDSQFGLTSSGPDLYSQYGPAPTFLTVLNQYGQATSLPTTDPNGSGTSNWEVEEALDVEFAHAIAPGAKIVLVEANSQSLSDFMASVSTAASQPGVSVVSMSWGFTEGQAVFASDEATYDRVFSVPGVTFVASTGDYGAADPEYPAFSPNVVAVGGTTLTLNADNSYNSETGWGYQSASVGAFIGSGGGLSLYEPEPAYQQGVQSTGSRTTPDVSFVADPATGVWIADPYNLDPSDPFEAWAAQACPHPRGLGCYCWSTRRERTIRNLRSTAPAPPRRCRRCTACRRPITT
jgi:hypothetical protein